MTDAQLRCAVAPLYAASPGVMLPTGMPMEAVRTEARVQVRYEGNTPASSTGDLPFVSFDLADDDSAANTVNYFQKLIVQIENNNVTVRPRRPRAGVAGPGGPRRPGLAPPAPRLKTRPKAVLELI